MVSASGGCHREERAAFFSAAAKMSRGFGGDELDGDSGVFTVLLEGDGAAQR